MVRFEFGIRNSEFGIAVHPPGGSRTTLSFPCHPERRGQRGLGAERSRWAAWSAPATNPQIPRLRRSAPSLPKNKSHKSLIIITLKNPTTTGPGCHSEQGRPTSLEESGWGLVVARFYPPTQIPRRRTPRNDRWPHYRGIPAKDRQVLGNWLGGVAGPIPVLSIRHRRKRRGGARDDPASLRYAVASRVWGNP